MNKKHFTNTGGRRLTRIGSLAMLCAAIVPAGYAQQALTWDEIRTRFLATNPTLQAAQLGIEESHTLETTAYLRPNPDMTTTVDQLDPFTTNPYRPLGSAQPYLSFSYLHERAHKRELRLESAKKGTAVAESQLADQQRTLIFNLRSAFVQTLQAKAFQALARENLAYYDQVIKVSRDRKQAGDIAQVDLDRLELQRVQYESDIETSTVNLRTAKIQLLTLLNDRTPVDRFDVTGPYEFSEKLPLLDDLRQSAIEARPDLKATVQSVDKAKTDHQLAEANGSTDPTFGLDISRNPPLSAYFGVSMNIPLRIFDKNQGEKARTEIDIRRNSRLQTAAEAQVFSDVDSAYATINANLALLRSYKARYLDQAVRVRETISFAYRNGGASLLEFLQAQQDYRSIQLNYLNLIGTYLTTASQLNLAVGREVIQ